MNTSPSAKPQPRGTIDVKIRVALMQSFYAAPRLALWCLIGAIIAASAPTMTRAQAPAGSDDKTAPKRERPVPGAGSLEDKLPDITPFETGVDYKRVSPGTRVTFNLEGADLTDLVRLISQITGRRFILPGKTRSIKATVYAPTKVTAAEAYQAFLSILELNGMALVPAGRYLKIVESGRVEGRPIPLLDNGERVPYGDRFMTRLQRVENISAQDASKLLERFKSGDGSLTAYAPTNMLIITDTGTNIRRMLRILSAVDVAATGEQVWIEPVHHADATELATRLSEIFETSAGPTTKTTAKKTVKKGKKPAVSGAATVGGAEARITKILADERTNSLIVMATERAYLRILEMTKHLDVPLEGEGRIHVHRLQHSDAEEIASTLSNLVSGGGRAPARGKAKTAQAASIFEGKVAVTAHKAANALVVTSSMHDYAALRHVIGLLDTERRQVFIEAVIMELSVNRGSSFGIAYHGGIPDSPADGATSVLGFNAASTIVGLENNADFLTGLAVGVQGPNLVGFSLPAFGVALNAAANSGDVNVLSTPHLIAMDNVEAEISVGQNVPLQTSGLSGLGNLGGLGGLLGNTGGQNAGALGGLAGLGGLGGLGGAVPRQDVGTTVTLTPHINETDEIRLEISEEISEAGDPSANGNLGVVSINRTRAKTEVVVRDQQTVVIGGLMRDGTTTSIQKVPVLGDIPLLGALFRSTTKTKAKRNLLLFLTPYIIRSPADLRAIYERKMRERQEFLDRFFVFSGTDYTPPMDYSRTRGLVGEIMRELANLAEQRRLNEAAANKPVPTHEPRPAVGEPTAEQDGDGRAAGDLVIVPEGATTPGRDPATGRAPETQGQPAPDVPGQPGATATADSATAPVPEGGE